MSAALSETASSEDVLFEVIEGQRVDLPPMGASETRLASYLVSVINAFAMQSIGLACAEMLFHLQIGRNRRPDVAFVRYDRWPRRRPIPPGDAWTVVPNLAAEVVSPTNTPQEVLDKLCDYFRAGVQLVWVIYPTHRQIYVYTSPKEVRILDHHDVLDGGQVVPGLQIPLATLFELVGNGDASASDPAEIPIEA